jgi:hypothetical protein
VTDSQKVVAGTPRPNGAIFRAPVGTTLPTSETSTLDTAFAGQGYAAQDGLERAITKAYETIRAWGGDEVKRTRTEIGVTLKFTLIEAANGDVATTIWGDAAVTITPATATAGTRIAVAYDGGELPESSWVFDLKDGDHVRRIVVPRGQVTTEEFTQTFADAQVVAYPVTLTLFKDAAGRYFYEYADDGVTGA